jgi:cytoskeleton protein RodZ
MEPQYSTEPPPDDRQDGAGEIAPGREGVGEILRLKREAYGQDLPTVAAQLHIRLTHLRAVEAGRFKDLPGMTYAAGFVRSYGDYLGLDGEELVRLFREEVAGIDRQVRLSVPHVASEGRIPGGAVLLLSGFLALVAYGVWYYLADRHKSFFDMVPEVPAQLRAILGKEAPTSPPSADKAPSATTAGAAAPAAAVQEAPRSAAKDEPPAMPPGTAASTAPTTTAPNAAAVGSGPGAASPAQPPPASTASAPLGAATAGTAAPAQPPAPPPPPATTVLVEVDELAPLPAEFNALLAAQQASAAASSEAAGVAAPPAAAPVELVMASPGFRVRLVARMDSWVQINDKTGRQIYAAVLRAGQGIEVPNQSGLLLTAGNVGGLDIQVDGEPLGPLGGVGLVRRDVPLDPAGLKSAAAATH